MDKINVRPWGAVAELINASSQSSSEILRTVQRLGLEKTVDVICDELSIRCNPPQISVPAEINLTVTCGDHSSYRTLAVSNSGLSINHADKNRELPEIKLDVIDLLSSLFGPHPKNNHPSREVKWRDLVRTLRTSQGVEETATQSERNRHAIHAILAASTDNVHDLGELAVRFGSDKWPCIHWYTKHYERHLTAMQDMPIQILEIGVGGFDDTDRGGASLRMWQRYFRRGLVYGLDIDDTSHVEAARIRTIQGDQSDKNFLDSLAQSVGPFDIVVDDGSHVNEHVKTSFRALFPYVRPGGIYVIEDLFTSYVPRLGGVDHDFVNADTSIGMLKALIDGLHYKRIQENAQWDADYFDQNIIGLHFYHNIAIIEKGTNSEDF